MLVVVVRVHIPLDAVYEGEDVIKWNSNFLGSSNPKYSSTRVNMKHLGILFKWGYGSLISDK